MRELMRAHGCDALAFTGADWFEWISNYPIVDQAFERPYLVLVTADGRSCALCSELGANGLAAARSRGEVWLDFATHYAEHSHTSRCDWTAATAPEMVAATLRQM